MCSIYWTIALLFILIPSKDFLHEGQEHFSLSKYNNPLDSINRNSKKLDFSTLCSSLFKHDEKLHRLVKEKEKFSAIKSKPAIVTASDEKEDEEEDDFEKEEGENA